VSVGLSLWLVGAGFANAWLMGVYWLVWAVIFARRGVERAPGMLVQGPIYAWFIVVAWRHEPWAGGALVVWTGTAIAATWPFFPSEMVPEFVSGIRQTWAEVRGRVARRPWPEEAPTQARLAPPRLTAPAPAILSVLSANLWHDWPRGRRRHERLEAFARLVENEGVDVILLQEVMRASLFEADEWLAGRLGMAYAYARANGHRAGIGFEEGIAVFSRLPLAEPRVQPLGVPGRLVRRLALAARVEAKPVPFWAVSAHLSLRPWRNRDQVRHLARWVDEVAGGRAVVIGGDFNASERAPQISAARGVWRDPFRELHPHEDAVTFERLWPWGAPLLRRRLDYVFASGAAGWRALEARHLAAPGGGHSDHRAVLVRLAVD
jgi:endonuclease/exonuclease/phosphatase family metal-dependent hydrolase